MRFWWGYGPYGWRMWGVTWNRDTRFLGFSVWVKS